MAACSTIAELIQAYVDDQLSQEERLVVEVHVAECPDCAILLNEMHEVTAAVVESLAPKRVSTTFVERVVAALPHMYEHAYVDDLAEIHRRANREALLQKVSHMMPYAAAAVLIIATALIMAVWPQQNLGFVAKVTNQAKLMRTDRSAAEAEVSIGDSVQAGDTFVANAESRLILALQTAEIKINGGSIVRVVNDREVELVKGEIFADVTSTGSPFLVKLGAGAVTVMGTQFVVQALEDKTVVTVAEGNVLFKIGAGYSEIKAGAQSTSVAGGLPTRAKPVEVSAITEWADTFVVTPEDVALAKNRGVELPLRQRQYAHLSRTRGELVPTQMLGFFDVPAGPFVIRCISVKRDAFGRKPQVPVESHFMINVYDAQQKKLASIKESYSIFDGSSQDAVLTLEPPVTLNGVFHITFQPYIESEMQRGDITIRAYKPIPDIRNNLQPLSKLPATESVSHSM